MVRHIQDKPTEISGHNAVPLPPSTTKQCFTCSRQKPPNSGSPILKLFWKIHRNPP